MEAPVNKNCHQLNGYYNLLKELVDNQVYGTVTFDFYKGEIREVVQNLHWKTNEINAVANGTSKQRLVIRPKATHK